MKHLLTSFLGRRGAVKFQLLLGLAVLMMMVPTFLYLAGPLRRPLMVEGDRLEARACPDCGGVKPECKRCSGRGQVPHVIPGPLRPTQIVGHLYGADEVPVAAASVKIPTSVGDISLKTDEKGRFGATLPPGSYEFRFEANGVVKTEKVVVEPHKSPIPVDKDLTFGSVDRPFFLSDKK